MNYRELFELACGVNFFDLVFTSTLLLFENVAYTKLYYTYTKSTHATHANILTY